MVEKLKVQIPSDYAERLNFDPTNLSHINSGRRKILFIKPKSVERLIVLMESARHDKRLEGLKLVDLVPELIQLLPYL